MGKTLESNKRNRRRWSIEAQMVEVTERQLWGGLLFFSADGQQTLRVNSEPGFVVQWKEEEYEQSRVKSVGWKVCLIQPEACEVQTLPASSSPAPGPLHQLREKGKAQNRGVVVLLTHLGADSMLPS